MNKATALHVYLALVALTLLSVTSAAVTASSGRTLLIPWALALAAAKAALIALFYMRLIREKALTWALVAAAAAAVLVLTIGLIPDFALRLGAGV